jgi:hypothetical protein
MEQLYDIYFAAKLVDGFDEATVRENLAKLFKANDVALDKLFSGKPQPVKRGVDKAGALKYKAAMARAGAVAAVKAHAGAQASPDSKTAPARPGKAPTVAQTVAAFDDDELPSSADIKHAEKPSGEGSLADRLAAIAGDPDEPTATDMTLAPAGSDVLSEDERQVVEEQAIDTSALHMAPDFAETEPLTRDTPPAPDTSHLSMGEVGEDIPHLELDEELLDPDVSHLSMGEVGEDIPHLEIEEELLDPDTSGMSLAPEGSDVLEEQYKHHDQAQAPSTDHLALEDEAP